jgi:hypothetical protein
VATRVAHHFVAFWSWTFCWFWTNESEEPSLFMRAAAALAARITKVFEDIGIEDGRTDFVDAAGPFAEVDLSAAVTAERKVLIGGADQHSAGGAAEEFGGFFLRRHGVGGARPAL